MQCTVFKFVIYVTYLLIHNVLAASINLANIYYCRFQHRYVVKGDSKDSDKPPFKPNLNIANTKSYDF